MRLTLQEDTAAQTSEGAAPECSDADAPKTTIHITQDGEYFAKINDAWYDVELSYIGTPIIGDHEQSAPTNLDPSPPAKWGEGYKSKQNYCYRVHGQGPTRNRQGDGPKYTIYHEANERTRPAQTLQHNTDSVHTTNESKQRRTRLKHPTGLPRTRTQNRAHGSAPGPHPRHQRQRKEGGKARRRWEGMEGRCIAD